MAAATDASEKLTITLPESSFDMFKADAPNLDVEISKEQLMDMYTKMTTMRRMEMAADGLYKAKKIRGFCHLCNGQVIVDNTFFLSCGCVCVCYPPCYLSGVLRVNAGESMIKFSFPISPPTKP